MKYIQNLNTTIDERDSHINNLNDTVQLKKNTIFASHKILKAMADSSVFKYIKEAADSLGSANEYKQAAKTYKLAELAFDKMDAVDMMDYVGSNHMSEIVKTTANSFYNENRDLSAAPLFLWLHVNNKSDADAKEKALLTTPVLDHVTVSPQNPTTKTKTVVSSRPITNLQYLRFLNMIKDTMNRYQVREHLFASGSDYKLISKWVKSANQRFWFVKTEKDNLKPVTKIALKGAQKYAELYGLIIPDSANWAKASGIKKTSVVKFDPKRFHPSKKKTSPRIWEWVKTERGYAMISKVGNNAEIYYPTGRERKRSYYNLGFRVMDTAYVEIDSLKLDW